MQCRDCQQALSPAEVLKREEWERWFEVFERACAPCDPDGLEDMEIPDHAPTDVDWITPQEDGTFTFPTAWLLPLCDRCVVLGWIGTVLYEWEGSYAHALMWAYEGGTYGCPQSPVMAVSWALVVKQWYECEGEPKEMNEYREAVQLLTDVSPRLTQEERRVAIDLAEDVFDIGRTRGALWVPNPLPEYVAVFQKAFED